MLTCTRVNEQLKQELNDMRHDYDDLKDNFDSISEISIIFAGILNEIERETWINQCGSVTNLQNKLRKILNDGKSKLKFYRKLK